MIVTGMEAHKDMVMQFIWDKYFPDLKGTTYLEKVSGMSKVRIAVQLQTWAILPFRLLIEFLLLM